jgi:hypothetical protein
MSKVAISLAISDYDHVRDLVSGRVTAEGLDINFQVLPTPEIFDRATRDQEWDVCEMSLGKWTGMFSQGDNSLVPIPIFLSRVFRDSALYVKKGERRRHARKTPRQACRRSRLRAYCGNLCARLPDARCRAQARRDRMGPGRNQQAGPPRKPGHQAFPQG